MNVIYLIIIVYAYNQLFKGQCTILTIVGCLAVCVLEISSLLSDNVLRMRNTIVGLP